MNTVSTSILTITSEPAVISQAGRIAFANSAACKILGDNCMGRPVAAVFGADIAGAQAGSFIADAPVCGVQCLVRVSTIDKQQYFLFNRRDTSPLKINDAFICFLRSNLMGLNMSVDLGRSRAEELGDRAMLACFRSLMRSYYRLLRVLENASFLQSLQTGAQPCSLRELDLSELVRQLLTAVGQLDGDSDYRLNIADDVRLAADPELIRQLLLNLLSNCRLHAAGCEKISVSLVSSGDCAVLSVSDNGCGMSKERLATVFDRHRHDYDMRDLSQGIGLGLSVVRGIAELHGGVLLLESREGYGTTVRICFNRSVRSKVSLHSPAAEDKGCARQVLTGLADCLSESCFSEKYTD